MWDSVRRIVALTVFSLIVQAPRADALTRATFEGPGDRDDVAGVQIVRGWTFSDVANTTITAVKLFIDGVLNTVVPCCSERQDVANAFPGQPNALTSGFGLTLNFNLLAPGLHTLRLDIEDSSGATASRTHAITVVRPGGFEFVDLVDLSSATVRREGQDIVLSGAQFRAAGSGQVAEIEARLRWLKGLQGLGIVGSTTGTASQTAGLQGPAPPVIKAQTGAGLYGIVAALVESPSNGQTGAGLGMIRGFAIAAAGRSITRVQLFIDGNPSLIIPCCSERRDVAAAFPTQPNALDSGFGVTFNYGLLSTGVHQLIIEIEDNTGDVRKIVRGILVRRVGDFEFLDSLDLSQASVRLQGQTLIIEAATARDSVSGQTKQRILRYRYDVAAQGFQLAESNAQEVMLDTLGTGMNGDTSSLDALRNSPGPDGISLPEAIAATNNTPPDEPVMMTFPFPGTVQSAVSAQSDHTVTSGQSGDSIPAITGGNITVDGDIDGDGAPDVTLAGQIRVEASRVTVRGISSSGITIMAPAGRSVANVAALGNTITTSAEGVGIYAEAQNTDGQATELEAVLLSGNQVIGGLSGMIVDVFGTTGLQVSNVTIAENMVTGQREGVLVRTLDTTGAEINQVGIVSNIIKDTEFYGIAVLSGTRDSNGDTIAALITENMVNNVEFNGIVVGSGSFGSTNGTVSATVTTNVVNNAGRHGIIAGGVEGSNGNVMLEIKNNGVHSQTSTGIVVYGGEGASTVSNMVQSTIMHNRVTTEHQSGIGIRVSGGFFDTANHIVTGEIRNNEVTGRTLTGILLDGGFETATSTVVDGMVADNVVTNAIADGIAIVGGFQGSHNNIVMGTVETNAVQGNVFEGIVLGGGSLSATDNTVDGTIRDNLLTTSGAFGIRMDGGFRAASTNMTLGTVQNNMVQEAVAAAVFLEAGWSASNNTLETMVADNIISDSFGDGILAVAGTTQTREANTEAALDNVLTGVIMNNNVQDSQGTGIAVFGGLDDSQAQVSGNSAVQDVISNTADGFTCEDGIPGNTAECTFQDNTDTGGAMTSLTSAQHTAQRLADMRLPVSRALRQRLSTHIEQVEKKDQELRARAATLEDSQRRNHILHVCTKLQALRDKLVARRQGRSPWAEHVSID